MALGFPFGFRVANAEPLDNKYGPYPDIATALASVLSGERYKGLTVNIDDDEYWWRTGTTDVDLVLKETDVSFSGLLAEDNDANGNDIVDLGNLTFRTGKNIDTEVGGTMNFGANASVMNWGSAGTVHNFFGSAINFEETQHYIEDKLITLNKGGSVDSGVGSGFEIEEVGVVTGYFKINNSRNAWTMKVPALAHVATLSLNNLTAARGYYLSNEDGTIPVLESLTSNRLLYSVSNGAIRTSANLTFNGSTLTLTGVLSVSSTITGSNLSGTNTGDQTITLTGDVTGSGTGSFAATIANNAVTLAKMADMATASFLGRNTASTGDPEVLSIATVKTMLNLTGTNSGEQTIPLTA